LSDQATLPTLDWPALVAGPVFVEFELQGEPRPKGRHRSRIGYKNGKPFVMQYPDPETARYEAVLAEAALLFMRGRAPTEQPVALLVHAYKPIAASWSKTDRAKALAGALLPTSKPDGDNYLKGCQDALNGIVWRDDAQVIDARVIKQFSDRPALRIEVREFVQPGMITAG
jgi:Holliday junction resolvase RusA-like endonuclease